jgi:hypothetical protein
VTTERALSHSRGLFGASKGPSVVHLRYSQNRKRMKKHPNMRSRANSKFAGLLSTKALIVIAHALIQRQDGSRCNRFEANTASKQTSRETRRASTTHQPKEKKLLTACFHCRTTANVSYTVNIQTPLFQGGLGTIHLEILCHISGLRHPLGHPGACIFRGSGVHPKQLCTRPISAHVRRLESCKTNSRASRSIISQANNSIRCLI